MPVTKSKIAHAMKDKTVSKGEGKYLTLIYDQLDCQDVDRNAVRGAVQVEAGKGM